MILLFLASGGSLQIAAFSCFVPLLFLSYFFILKDKMRIKSMLIVFVSSLFGSLLNVAAPGNYVRRSVISQEYNMLEGIINAFYCLRYPLHLRKMDLALLCILSAVLLWMLSSIKIKIRHPVLISVVTIIIMPLHIFPVTFGYNSAGFPIRCQWVAALIFILCLMINLMIWMMWIKERIDDVVLLRAKKLVLFLACVSVIVVGAPRNLRITQQYEAISKMIDGSLSRCSRRWGNVLAYIETSKDSKIVIPKDMLPDDIGIIRGIGIIEGEPTWINEAIARYYGKDQIFVE